MSKADINKWACLVDHTSLAAQRRVGDIERLCREALQWGFYSVCVNPKWLSKCVKLLENSQTLPITVVGFPLGANTTNVKVYETKEAIQLGAKEIDMVIDIGAIIDDDWTRVSSDIRAVRNACEGIPLKVILETAYLNKMQIKQACQACVDGGAQFVKTSTGFASKGAELETVRLMRECVGPSYGVKASGGVKDVETFLAFINAGANRIGTSSSHVIFEELSRK